MEKLQKKKNNEIAKIQKTKNVKNEKNTQKPKKTLKNKGQNRFCSSKNNILKNSKNNKCQILQKSQN